MKFGVSTFAYRSLLETGHLTIEDMARSARNAGAQHLEVASVTFAPSMDGPDTALLDDPTLAERLRDAAAAEGLQLSNLAISADLIADDRDRRRSELDRVHAHLRLAERLGIRHFRHDVTPWAFRDDSAEGWAKLIGRIAEACAEIAETAAQMGIVSSVENHGRFLNGSSRVDELLRRVDSAHFRLTLDVGNSLVVDEPTLDAVQRGIPDASVIQFKDFYVRGTEFPDSPEWILTNGGHHLQGAVLGWGDLPLPEIFATVATSGFDGFVSLEYEGLADPILAVERGLETMRQALKGEDDE